MRQTRSGERREWFSHPTRAAGGCGVMLLDTIRGVLADIAYSRDMTLPIARVRAEQLYRDIVRLMDQEQVKPEALTPSEVRAHFRGSRSQP